MTGRKQASRERSTSARPMASTDKRPLKLLHMSDLHIGTDIRPEEALAGLEAALALGRQTHADAILIAGDLFDSHRVPSETVSGVLDDLGACDVPVVILPGNHDTVLTQRLWSGDLPRGVTILQQAEGELLVLEELGLAVWGRPVYVHEPQFRPLAGMPPRPGNGWYVAMGHGLLIDDDDVDMRSSPISPAEIGLAACDYIALGHIHVFRDVSQNGVPAYYSGAPSGAGTRSVALVELDPSAGVSVSPLRIS